MIMEKQNLSRRSAMKKMAGAAALVIRSGFAPG